MPANPHYTLYPYGSKDTLVHGQILEFLQEGESWLKSQRPTAEWDAVIDMLGPSDSTLDLVDQSNTGFNNGKRITKEIVASLSNFRYEGEIDIAWDRDLYNQATALTKRDQAWFKETHGHHRLREILQYGVALGTGYARQEWDKNYWGPGRGDIRLTATDPRDVLCVQLPADHDLQRAYIVFIKEELPINLAKRIYSRTNEAFAASLQPDRDSPGWIDKGLRRLQSLMGGSPIFRFLGNKKNTGSFPTVDIFHAYIMDDSINQVGEPIEMGTHGANWSYMVPSYGSDIPTGVGNGTRKATVDDARLFPLRRLCIFSRGVPFPCYDNSSPWWHGQVPLARFRFNDWAWEALGQSVVGDTRTMGIGIESIMRDIEDSSHARMDPPLLFDDTKVSKGFAEQINPRKSGVRAAADLNFGEIFKIVGEQWQYEVPMWIRDYLNEQIARQEKLTGSPDLVAIAKANQVPSQGTLEKLMEMAGPLVQDMIRSVEEPLYDMGEQRKALYLQYDTHARRLQLTGPLGEEEIFDYSPDLIVPVVKGESILDRRERAKRYLHEFKYNLTQSGINEIHRMSTKLAFLQLQKAGLPISWWTMARIWQVPKFGPLPLNVTTGAEVANEMEAWIAQKHIERELQEELQGGIATATGQPGPGRPQTYQQPPHLEQKDGGTRSTIATS